MQETTVREISLFAFLREHRAQLIDEWARAVREVSEAQKLSRPALLDHIPRRRRTSDVTGTELGLFISKGIVEAHGGRLVVESTMAKGTTFRFRLPVESAGVSRGSSPDIP